MIAGNTTVMLRTLETDECLDRPISRQYRKRRFPATRNLDLSSEVGRLTY